MTSSHKRPRAPSLRRVAVIGLALAAFVAAVVGWFTLAPTRQDPAAARDAVQRSLALYKADNANGAKVQALNAVRLDPNSTDAHIALAQAMLALDDGIGAEDRKSVVEGKRG